MSISTEYIETVLFKIVTSSSDYRGVSQITLHFNITVVNDPVSFEYALPKLLTVKAQLEDGVMQGETKFIYTSPRALDKQDNKITWVIPVPENNPDFMSIVLNENNTFTLTVDREMLNINNTGKNNIVI